MRDIMGNDTCIVVNLGQAKPNGVIISLKRGHVGFALSWRIGLKIIPKVLLSKLRVMFQLDQPVGTFTNDILAGVSRHIQDRRVGPDDFGLRVGDKYTFRCIKSTRCQAQFRLGVLSLRYIPNEPGEVDLILEP